MNARDTLYILPALHARSGLNGTFILTRKFLDGVMEYAHRWPGRVIVAIEKSNEKDSNLDHVEVSPEELPFALRWMPAAADDLAREMSKSRLVLASLVDKHLSAARVCHRLGVPIVYISEYSVLTRRQIIRSETRNPILRWRRELWTVQLERRIESAVRQANGVQCNGTPTYDAYRTISRNALLYFDTRVRREQLAKSETLEQRLEEMRRGKPLRLAFSGRLIAMKGADHLPRVAAELKRLHVPFRFDICGGGALEGQLRSEIRQRGLTDSVHMRGVLDFRTELMPLMARQVDVFVCCHPQGDPSCTYLETMSCGTPIVGYDNEAFAGLVRTANVGWLTPLNDPVRMAQRIAELSANREALVRGALDSLAFAAQHTFETTMQARIDHMLQCAAAKPMVAGVRA